MSVEETEDFAVDFFGEKAWVTSCMVSAWSAARSSGCRVGMMMESGEGARLGHGVETFGLARGLIVACCVVRRRGVRRSLRRGGRIGVGRGKQACLFETSICVAQLVADLAERGAEILRVALVNVGDEGSSPSSWWTMNNKDWLISCSACAGERRLCAASSSAVRASQSSSTSHS